MAETKHEFTRRTERIEELVSRVESSGDMATRAVAKELLQSLLELHAAALQRMLDSIAELPGAEPALRQIAADELVSGVLSLHDLHPVAVEERVAAAIEAARPFLQSHGGDVELASVEDNVVHVRLQGNCGSCSGSSETLSNAVESAIYGAAPEIAQVIPEPMLARPHSDLVTLRAS
jgi:Fe-S cluster biogenesis protein NfuA